MNATGSPQPKVVYPTYGVHNPPRYSPCECPDCLYPRGPGEPSDPLYPLYWSAKWTMYRVFNHYAENPPPYDGKPPASLKPGVDYQVSYGATYYDRTWRGPNGEEGAMLEHYEEWSLPIFPMDNLHRIRHDPSQPCRDLGSGGQVLARPADFSGLQSVWLV
jgi:hypothetical protein